MGVLVIVMIAQGAHAAVRLDDVGPKTFVSELYGYEIVLPAKYDAFYARTKWNGKIFPFGGTGRIDEYRDWEQNKLLIGATHLPGGTTLREWEAAHLGLMRSRCEESRVSRRTTLAGRPAREVVSVCPGYDVLGVITVHRGRGYIFQYVSLTEHTPAADRRNFEVARHGFRFTPA